jgi:DNA modification methylase
MLQKKKGINLLFNPYATESELEASQGVMTRDKYGFVPSTVWDVKKSKMLVDYCNDRLAKGSYEKSGKKKKSGQKALSMLPPDIVMRIVQYYTVEGDNVLDPFSNRGVTAMIAYLAKRNGYCTEIVPTYVKDMEERFEVARQTVKNNNKLIVKCADACNSPYNDEMFQLIYTSPPFWNIEKYESVDGQLSDIHEYKEFLKSYYKVMKECYRLLEEGGFIVYMVNDFRRDGVFYNFHGDTIRLLKKAGFVQHDLIINKLNSASMTSVGSIEKSGSKIMPKTHEFIIVFKKPYSSGKYKGMHRFQKMALEK